MPSTLFQTTKDLAYLREADLEYFQTCFPAITWYQIDQTQEKNIYGEYTKGDKDHYRAFHSSINTFVEVNPAQKLLNKLGISDKRDFGFELSKALCDKLGFLPKIGDRFDWGSYQCEVMNIEEGSFFANYQGESLHYFGTAKKARTFKED